MHDDRGIDADDIFAFLRHSAPPGLLEVAFEFDAERAVIPKTIDAAVDFRGLENEPASLAERDDLFHALVRFQFSHTKAEQCYACRAGEQVSRCASRGTVGPRAMTAQLASNSRLETQLYAAGNGMAPWSDRCYVHSL